MRTATCIFILFFTVIIFFSCTEPDIGPTTPPSEPTQSPVEPEEVNFVEFQGIETNGAYDWEHFYIGEEHYLVVANYYNDSTRNINSKIYKWNGYTFRLHQTLGTNGAMDWEYFSIEENHFLVVANYHNDSSPNINSRIYKWDGENGIFSPFQTLGTNGAIDWEYFSIEDDHFLVVANQYNGTTRNIPSRIYRWNGAEFTSYQNISTNGAQDWRHFIINGENYLVVANSYNNSTYNIPSRIYKWDPVTKLFTLHQEIDTNGALDWDFFTIDGYHFLAISNNYNGTTYNINSRIYIWNPAEQEFDHYQTLATSAANDCEYFCIGDDHFLSVANAYDGSTYNINSVIYKWDNDTEEFIPDQDIPTMGARASKFFTIGDTYFLAIANRYNGSSYNTLSMIYTIPE